MATTPAYASTPRCGMGTVVTGNTARDGTASGVVTIFTAGGSGSKIERVRIKASVTTSAGMVRLFIYDGSTYFLFDEINIASATVSATVQGFQWENSYRDLVLPTGYSLRATTHNSESMNIVATGGDF